MGMPSWSGWALLAVLIAIPVVLLVVVAFRPELPRRTKGLLWAAIAVFILLLVAALIAIAIVRAWMDEII